MGTWLEAFTGALSGELLSNEALNKQDISKRTSLWGDKGSVGDDDSGLLKLFAAGSGLSTIGQYFPFVNREVECALLKEQIILMDSCFGKSFNEVKSIFPLIACLGFSGIGKTTFIRKALLNVKFPNKLYLNSESRLNIDIDSKFENITNGCSKAATNNDDILEHNVAMSLLFHFCVYMLKEGTSIISSDMLCDKMLACANSTLKVRKLKLLEAVDIIFYQNTEITSILINIDKVDGIGQIDALLLKNLMYKLTNLILNKRRVYITISGLYHNSVLTAMTKTGMKTVLIRLSPLKYSHMYAILNNIFSYLKINPFANCSESSPWLHHLLWAIGGIPRLLENMVRISSQVLNTVDDLPAILYSLTSVQYIDIYTKLQKNEFCNNGKYDGGCTVSRSLYSNIIALVVSALPVEDNVEICANLTVADAEFKNLLFRDNTDRVLVPPLYLYDYYKFSYTKGVGDAPLVLLDCMGELSCSHRDMECVYASMVINRLLAYRILGHKKVLLSKVLNVTLSSDDDVAINIPAQDECKFMKVEHTLTLDNFASFEQSSGYVGYVNTRTASSADGFIILQTNTKRKCFVWVQEKSSIISRDKYVNDGTVPNVITNINVEAETKKIFPSNDSNHHVALYVSDNNIHENFDITILPLHTYMITSDTISNVLGELLGTLRHHAVYDSTMDSGNKTTKCSTVPIPPVVGAPKRKVKNNTIINTRNTRSRK